MKTTLLTLHMSANENNVPAILEILQKNYSGKTMLASEGETTPFRVLIATVLSARNRDETTHKVVERLFAIYKSPWEIAQAPLKRLESLVRQSGFYHVKAARIKEISRIIDREYDGSVPKTMDELLKLPGVGRKTAGCVLVYAFQTPAIPVDTHVHRISNRLGWVKTKTPLKTEEALIRLIPRSKWMLVNELLVLHGKSICRPIGPQCAVCPVATRCARIGV
jgi:endonuclease III